MGTQLLQLEYVTPKSSNTNLVPVVVQLLPSAVLKLNNKRNLVTPAGKVGYVKLSGVEIKVEDLVDLALGMGVESIKFMPLKGLTHLEELVYLCKVAAEKGIVSVEPAGGISADNIVEIVNAVRGTGIPVFMPHIFGSTIDKENGRTIPEEVAKIIRLVRG